VRSRAGAAVATVAVLLGSALSGCGGPGASSSGSPVADVSMHDDDGLNGVVLPRPYRVPDLTLRDTEDRPVDLATDSRTPLTLVFFGYTHCPDICSVVMANIASALTRLDPADRADVAMRFVTTDPARDDAATVRTYVRRFDPAFDGLTGNLATIVRLGDAFDVEIAKGRKLPSGGYDVAHGTQVVGLRPDATAPFVWTEGTDPASLAEDITTILHDEVPGL
jgi:protein SCO1